MDQRLATANIDVDALLALTSLLSRDIQTTVWRFNEDNVTQIAPFALGNNGPSDGNRGAKQFRFNGLIDTLTTITERGFVTERVGRRHVVLISGSVEDSDNGWTVAESRQNTRLIDVVSRLQSADASVMAIDLHKGSDQPLLQTLAAATGGTYRRSSPGKDLETTFLHTLEQTTALDYLPLHDNLMRIDDSVTTATLLLFRDDPSLEFQLIPPFADEFTQVTAPDNVQWQQKPHYELITIRRPKVGTWQIDAPLNPDNRAVVTTNLHVAVTPLERNISVRSNQTLTIQLIRNNVRVTEKATLDNVALQVIQKGNDKPNHEWYPLDDGRNSDSKRGDGIYTVVLSNSLTAGSHELIVDLEGRTFQRQHRQFIDVHKDPVWMDTTLLPSEGHYVVSIIPRIAMLDPESLIISAFVNDPSGKKWETVVPRLNLYEWRLGVKTHEGRQPYRLELNVAGTSSDGKAVSVWLASLDLGQSSRVRADEISHSDDVATLSEKAEQQKPATEPPSGSYPNRIGTVLQLVAVNTLLLTVLYFGMRRWRRGNENWLAEIRGALTND